jgi:hypothetical protein
MYSAAFAAVSVTAAQDIFELVAPAAITVAIHGLLIGQSSDYGDAAAEGIGLSFLRGHTTSGSGGTTLTPTPLWPGGAAASGVYEANNTTVATGGTPVTMLADAINVQGGYQLWFPPEARLILTGAQRGVFRITAPADAITMSGTVFFEELS